MEYSWIREARKHINQKEIKGLQSNPFIVRLWDSIPWLWNSKKDDSALPWCGAFVRYCLVNAALPVPKEWYRARAFINHGLPCHVPVYGCIGVIKNAKGQYHVGFVVGRDNAGNILMLGGNQGDAVKVSAFKSSAFVAYRWPDIQGKVPPAYPLPILSAELSTSEY
jgi:uncharacterized protein (TIGR02594 family)